MLQSPQSSVRESHTFLTGNAEAMALLNQIPDKYPIKDRVQKAIHAILTTAVPLPDDVTYRDDYVTLTWSQETLHSSIQHKMHAALYILLERVEIDCQNGKKERSFYQISPRAAVKVLENVLNH